MEKKEKHFQEKLVTPKDLLKILEVIEMGFQKLEKVIEEKSFQQKEDVEREQTLLQKQEAEIKVYYHRIPGSLWDPFRNRRYFKPFSQETVVHRSINSHEVRKIPSEPWDPPWYDFED